VDAALTPGPVQRPAALTIVLASHLYGFDRAGQCLASEA
jgi:hypothetical protein